MNMLFFLIIMIFILFIIFILPKYKNKKDQNTSSPKKSYHDNNATSLLGLKFHQKSETVHLFGQTITNSLFYTCELTSYIPFAINIHLKPNVVDMLPERLPYPPYHNELNELSEEQQGYFIQWLANGKPIVDNIDYVYLVGYAYLYYYGLEYRALMEKLDRKNILFEVIALVKKFDTLEYAYNFIIYLTLVISFNDFSQEELNTLKLFYEENKQKYSNNPYNKNDPAYKAVIKKISPQTKHAVSFYPHQLLYLSIEEYAKLSTRKQELLDYYFKRVLEKFNETELCTVKKELYIYYTAIPYSFINAFGFSNVIQIPYESLSPTYKAKKIYTHALTIIKEEIKQPIKNFANSSDPLTEIEKYLALPETLKREITPQKLFNFKDYTITNIENIANILGFPLESTITFRQSIFIAEACESLGYEIEPSTIITQKVYKKDSMVILYENQFIKKLPSEQYEIASLFTDIGYKIALEDAELLQIETHSIDNYIKNNFNLSPAEQYRLQMRGELIAHTKKIPADNTIKRLIKTTNSNINETIIQFVLAIASSDGIIKEKEFRLLQKIAKQLTVSEEQLKTILTQFLDTAKTPVVFEQENSQISAVAKPAEEIKLQLNTEKLAKVQINTAEIHTVLQEIFGEEQAEAIKSEPQETDIPEEDEQNQPDNDLQTIITTLLEKENWTRSELMNIIQNKGIMLNSLLDQINEWAENEYGDFLIEEEDTIYTINSDVAELIKQKNN